MEEIREQFLVAVISRADQIHVTVTFPAVVIVY
jgi:hypothetical protein